MSRCSAARVACSAPIPAPIARPGIVVALRPASPLSDLERRVVVLSRRDPPPAGAVGQAFGRIGRLLFGGPATAGLADPRLEALRRFAVLLRIGGGHVTATERARFLTAGFTDAQIDPIHRLCADRSAARRDRAARAYRLRLAVALWLGVLPPVALALTDLVGDGLIGAAGAGLLFAAIAPLLARLG